MHIYWLDWQISFILTYLKTISDCVKSSFIKAGFRGRWCFVLGGLVLTFLNGTTGEIVMQLILSCNSKTIFYKGKKILKYNNNKYCIVILYGFKMYLLCNMCFHWLLLTVNNCSTLNEWPYWILQTSVCLIIASNPTT
jgi:hypothetical protein